MRKKTKHQEWRCLTDYNKRSLTTSGYFLKHKKILFGLISVLFQ